MLIFWIVLSIAAIVIDMLTSAFLFVWFAIGGVSAIIANILGYEMFTQIVLFGVVSLITIAIGYPWSKRTFKDSIKRTPLMEETYIGKEFIATEDIYEYTRFKVEGIYWTGYNKGNRISKGSKFKVIGIDGNKLLIEGIREE